MPVVFHEVEATVSPPAPPAPAAAPQVSEAPPDPDALLRHLETRRRRKLRLIAD